VNTYMRRFLLVVGVGSLAFSLACGGGNGSGGGFGGGGGGNGSFSNSSLSGQYAYQLSGFNLQDANIPPFREAGVFTADGNGHITSGIDDSAGGGSPLLLSAFTGTYSVSSDGTAQITINFSSSGSATFALTLVSSSKVYMIENDNSGIVLSGVAQKQDTSAFSSIPSGTFAFRMHDITVGIGGATTSTGKIGAFTVSNGTITGNADSNQNLVIGTSTFTGSMNFPDANSGRGTGTLNDSVSGPSTFVYYVIDASHILFFSQDSGIVGLGQAEKQSGTFSTASLSGPYAFGGVGDAVNFPNNTNVAGRFTADSSGGINSGSLDQVEDGVNTSVSTPVTFTGTYTVASTGRADITFNSTIGTIHYILWMVSPSRAFSLTASSSEVEDGTVDLQTGTFSNSTLNGTYAFNLTGLDGTSSLLTNDFVGTLKWDGTSAITGRNVLNLNGAPGQPTNTSGTYTVSSNGRVLASINGISNNVVFYMISPTDAYLVQNDANVELHGAMSKQP
jgi:hypothetical protein